MSEWNEFKLGRDTITFSDDKEEMHILFDSNYNGNVYLTLNVSDVLDALRTITTEHD